MFQELKLADPVEMSAEMRWQPLRHEDESLLLWLASLETEIGDTALDAVTHLPLRASAWSVIRGYLHAHLAVADEGRRAFLNRVAQWMPNPTSPPEIGNQDNFRNSWRGVRLDPNEEWMHSPAPGCRLIDATQREEAVTKILTNVEQSGDAITQVNWWSTRFRVDADAGDAANQPRATASTDELDPLEVTAFFRYAYLAERYPFLLGNSLVRKIGLDTSFTPDLLGLFEIYRGALARYAGRVERELGAWVIEGRDDDEDDACWLSWQLAWTASRGGIVDVVAGLRSHLTFENSTNVIAALSFVADAADYSVQQEGEFFGGGRVPLRLAPNSLHRVFADTASENFAKTENFAGTLGSVPSAPRRAGANRIVRVFYGTSRARSDEEWGGVRYTSARGQSLAVGFVDVSVPAIHRKGHIERPSIWRLELRENVDRHVVIIEIAEASTSEFFETMNGNFAKSGTDTTFVFIHGYNVTFEEAARRTAQLGYDLGIAVPAMFSWPSCGLVRDYIADGTAADWSVPFLMSFLRDIRGRSSARTVHLIAHSLGNRLLAGVLTELREEAGAGPLFHQVVLTAPDIDAEVFERQIAAKIRPCGAGMTLYVSSTDKALKVAHRLHRARRAGDSGENIVIVNGIDTIDATKVSTGFGHSVFGDVRTVVEDISLLLRLGLPPGQRNLTAVQRGLATYWEFPS